jgi:hypothetical protein
MTANVVGSGGVPDSTYGSPRGRSGETAAPPAAAGSAPPEAAPPGPNDLLLTIETDPVSGGFVYVTIDKRTGAVLRRLDRDQLVKLREAASYAAGAVISTRA